MANAGVASARTLVELGFSEYEARTYAGLVGREPLTGYALAKETAVPQPKVYETLNRLAQRGAVVKVAENPATWAAISPSRLLENIESGFRRRLITAELELSRLHAGDSEDRVRPLWGATDWRRIRDVAARQLREATERVYISAHQEQLCDLQPELVDADSRGLRIDVLTFGDIPFELSHGYIVRHRSTEGVIYPHHQARHLALVTDGVNGVWGLARSGDDWDGVWCEDDLLLPALIKGYIRHDLYVQRIYGDLDDRLHEVYGPSLEGLMGREPHEAQSQSESDLA